MARAFLCFLALACLSGTAGASSVNFPWPWHSSTSTTSTPQSDDSAALAFALGFADGLGIGDARTCIDDNTGGFKDLVTAVHDYLQGDWMDKAKAVGMFADGVKDIVLSLGSCSTIASDGIKYKLLLKYLQNPEYYSMHNAAVLGLNLAEDRHQLDGCASAWKKGDYREAGSLVSAVMLDVLENPGLPDTNGTASLDFAAGVAQGFSGAIDNGCIKHVSVEIGAIVGGVSDLVTVIEIPQGLASLFQGLTGLVPLYKECMADKSEIMGLLHDMKDLRHPAELARDVAHDMQLNGIDITMEATSAFLDFKGKSWKRFGEDVGAILSKLFVPPADARLVVV